MPEGPTRQPMSEPTADTAGLKSVPLSQADRAILALEGPTIAGHICKVIRLGPPAPPPTTLIETIAARLPCAPALTWKLTGPSETPCWRPNPSFDCTTTYHNSPASSWTTPPCTERSPGCSSNAWTATARSGEST
jgi:hypothetical protein